MTIVESIRTLVGSGHKIGLFTLPVVVIGLAVNLARPSLFSVGGPPAAVVIVSVLVLATGLLVWLWSVVLILTKVPRRELMTTGPYAIVKHPLYTGVAFLVLPSAGFLLNTWLGALIGVVLYLGSRIYSPEEERTLSNEFGDRWTAYSRNVRIPWL